MSQSTLIRRAALSTLARGSVALALGASAIALPEPAAAQQLVAATAGRGRIGFDLWSGVPGTQFGDRIDRTVGSRRIHGPYSWRHPVTGETVTIYIRDNRERNGGLRTSYLTMKGDGTALSRVFDRRTGQTHDRFFVDDAFVPMGPWQAGTRRRYTMTQVQAGRSERFQLTLRMLRTGFEFEGRRGSIEYDWIARTLSGQTVFHQRFVYSPGIGFADFDNRL